MSRLVVSSDLHLGHRNIIAYRKQFKTEDEHHWYVYEKHLSTIKKNDVWYCLGDAAFTEEWLKRLGDIRCARKTLILGNHDTERLSITKLSEVFDSIHSLKSHKAFGKRVWFSHCPIHPDEIRSKHYNIHGHTHENFIKDCRYINACVEHTNYGVVPFDRLI